VPRYFFDTNAIIEAHRAGCWNAIVNKFKIETVTTCRTEVLTGDARRPGYVQIEPIPLDKGLVAHQVPKAIVMDAILSCQAMVNMDEGEQELVAFVRTIPSADWRLCSPDNSSYRAMQALGLLDKLISLEDVCSIAGQRKVQLRENYTNQWHSRARTRFLLGDC
jgi:hypothetical protein